MGLTISSAISMGYINLLLENISCRSRSIAKMDDVLVHSLKRHHMDRLEALFQELLKLFLKKYQLYRIELVYMGNVFSMKDKKISIQPLRSRVEGIQKIPPPKW